MIGTLQLFECDECGSYGIVAVVDNNIEVVQCDCEDD